MTQESKEAMEMVVFMCELGNSIDKSLDDNKISILDAANFYGAIRLAGPAFKDFKIKDFASMPTEDQAEMISEVSAKLNLKSDRTEEIIKEALASAAQIAKLVKAVKR